MNAPNPKVDVVAAFRLRCEVEGELSLHEAVDGLQANAIASGIIDTIGHTLSIRVVPHRYAQVDPIVALGLQNPSAAPGEDVAFRYTELTPDRFKNFWHD